MNESRKEALLNEYKGNLYEFLFAHSLARHFDCELTFLNCLNDHMKIMLEQQERFLREFYPDLITDLPILAQSLVKDLTEQLSLDKIKNVNIIGKVAMASHDTSAAESDVLIETDLEQYLISLKLGKSQSFLNTKSAGIKSFFKKYFVSFDQIELIQSNFNSFYDKNYEQFAMRMHQLAEIDFEGGFKAWIANGLNELPGALKDEFRECYVKFSHHIANELISVLKDLEAKNRELFEKSLYPLLGFSDQKIIQASTYYKNVDSRYVLDKNRIDSFKNKLEIKNFNIKTNVNYCDIIFDDRILQIRLKAMNKFTHSSYKVNCSVKYLD